MRAGCNRDGIPKIFFQLVLEFVRFRKLFIDLFLDLTANSKYLKDCHQNFVAAAANSGGVGLYFIMSITPAQEVLK